MCSLHFFKFYENLKVAPCGSFWWCAEMQPCTSYCGNFQWLMFDVEHLFGKIFGNNLFFRNRSPLLFLVLHEDVSAKVGITNLGRGLPRPALHART